MDGNKDFIHNLCTAASKGDSALIKKLLSNSPGADLNIFDETSKLTPLFVASQHGCLECVILLLNFGVEVNQATHLGTALHIAASKQHKSVVLCLLCSGASPRLLNSSGQTAQQEAKSSTLEMFKEFQENTPNGLREKFSFLAPLSSVLSGSFAIRFFDHTFKSFPYKSNQEIWPLLVKECETRAMDAQNMSVKDSRLIQLSLTPKTKMAEIHGQEIYIFPNKSKSQTQDPLIAVFQNADRLDNLRRFAAEKQIAENIEFLLDVYNYKEGFNRRAQSIFNEFIRPEANCQINIPYKILHEIQNELEVTGTFNSTLFDDAHRHITALIRVHLSGFPVWETDNPLPPAQLHPQRRKSHMFAKKEGSKDKASPLADKKRETTIVDQAKNSDAILIPKLEAKKQLPRQNFTFSADHDGANLDLFSPTFQQLSLSARGPKSHGKEVHSHSDDHSIDYRDRIGKSDPHDARKRSLSSGDGPIPKF